MAGAFRPRRVAADAAFAAIRQAFSDRREDAVAGGRSRCGCPAPAARGCGFPFRETAFAARENAAATGDRRREWSGTPAASISRSCVTSEHWHSGSRRHLARSKNTISKGPRPTRRWPHGFVRLDDEALVTNLASPLSCRPAHGVPATSRRSCAASGRCRRAAAGRQRWVGGGAPERDRQGPVERVPARDSGDVLLDAVLATLAAPPLPRSLRASRSGSTRLCWTRSSSWVAGPSAPLDVLEEPRPRLVPAPAAPGGRPSRPNRGTTVPAADGPQRRPAGHPRLQPVDLGVLDVVDWAGCGSAQGRVDRRLGDFERLCTERRGVSERLRMLGRCR